MRLTFSAVAACLALAACGQNASLETHDVQVLEHFVELNATCPGDVCVPDSHRREVVECMRSSLREQRSSETAYQDVIGTLDGTPVHRLESSDLSPERIAQMQQASITANQVMTVCALNIVPLAPQQLIAPAAPAPTPTEVNAVSAPEPAAPATTMTVLRNSDASGARSPSQAISASAPRGPDPCVQARADWASAQNSNRVAVLRIYRDNLPAACVVQRALADARIQELSEGGGARPQQAPNGARPPAQAPDDIALAAPNQAGSRSVGGGRLIWVAQPSSQLLSQLYPRRARQEIVDGGATLDCVVLANLTADCRVVSERPVGYAFGEAALRASHALRVGPARTDGSPATGAHSQVTVNFQHEILGGGLSSH